MAVNKKVKALQGLEFDILALPLKQIAVHPALKKILEAQSNFEYLMSNKNLINEDYLKAYLALYSFFLVEEDGVYLCFNNVRVLQLAKIVFAR
jgi:hypothetical protein